MSATPIRKNGRPSKLTDHQLDTIKARIAKGEKPSDLAKEFGVSRSALSERVSEQVGKIKAVAHDLVKAETALKSLTPSDQVAAVDFAAKLRSISEHLQAAAEVGSRTAHRLATMARTQLDRVKDGEPMAGDVHLQGAAILTKMANEASEIGLNLLKANKDAVDEQNQRALEPERITRIEEVIVSRDPVTGQWVECPEGKRLRDTYYSAAKAAGRLV